MARPHKKHHKIPSIYLHAFADANGKVWIANKDLKIFQQSPENILSEKDYYTVRFPHAGGTLSIETKYLNGIEATYSKIYKETISNKKILSLEDKAKMSIFIASLFERAPNRREAMQQFFDRAKEMMDHMKNLPEKSKRSMGSPLLSSGGPTISGDELLELGKDVGSLHSSLIPDTVEELAPIIFRMNWAFLVKTEGTNQFWTSDDPCTLVNPYLEEHYKPGTIGATPGFLQEHVELTLPFSSEICLLGGYILKYDLLYVPATKADVEEMNRRTARHSRNLICNERTMLEEKVKRVEKYRKNYER